MIISACNSTVTNVKPSGTVYASKPGNCEIVFYKNEKPAVTYERVGEIESHIKKNIFLGERAQLEDEAYKELRKKACKLGGDAVIIDDHMESTAAELTHVHVWATVIKLH
jgi:hypothetical protein